MPNAIHLVLLDLLRAKKKILFKMQVIFLMLPESPTTRTFTLSMSAILFVTMHWRHVSYVANFFAFFFHAS